MKRRSRKRRRRGLLDRISQLPDDVLVHILSLLETKDAVRTSSLSRAWRHRRLWTHVYNLSFDFSSASQIRWLSLNRTLDLLRAPKLATFTLRIHGGELIRYHKNMLIELLRFAVIRHAVEVINLYLPSSEESRLTAGFFLPEFLFSCDSSLRELTTNGCHLSVGIRVGNCASLRVLDFGFAWLIGLENLLSNGCPSLESLTLCYVSIGGGGCDIDITHNKLKKLVIQQPSCTKVVVIYRSTAAHRNNIPDPESWRFWDIGVPSPSSWLMSLHHWLASI